MLEGIRGWELGIQENHILVLEKLMEKGGRRKNREDENALGRFVE